MIAVFKSILILAVAFGVAQCSEAEQKGTNKKKKADVIGDDDDDDDDDDGGEGGEGGEGGGGDDPLTTEEKEVFELWCEKAIEIPRVKEHSQDFYDRLCKDGKPTKLFTSTLIKTAFDGSGDPKINLLEDYEHSSTETIANIGTAIELPISIENHFEKVGPRQGDVSSLKDLAIKQEADEKSIQIKIEEEYEEDGKYHVRGWKIHSVSSKTILFVIKLETDTLVRADQYELEKGKAYLYSQYMIDGKKGIKDYDQFVAGVQVGDKSYLITVARVKAENKGQSQTAEQEIPKSAEILMRSNYDAAKKAQ
jgi:hypothetical protein